MTESVLVEKCKHGDITARKELYDIYSQMMLGICLRYIGDRMLAQDLLHDGFIKAFLSFHSFEYRGEGSLKAWLCRIFINTSLEYLRKNNDLKQNLPLDEWREYGEDIPEEEADRVPNDVLLQFIGELSDGYRTVFNLYTFEEKSHHEIGSMLGINESSSRSQLSRAKAILIKKVQSYIKRNER